MDKKSRQAELGEKSKAISHAVWDSHNALVAHVGQHGAYWPWLNGADYLYYCES